MLLLHPRILLYQLYILWLLVVYQLILFCDEVFLIKFYLPSLISFSSGCCHSFTKIHLFCLFFPLLILDYYCEQNYLNSHLNLVRILSVLIHYPATQSPDNFNLSLSYSLSYVARQFFFIICLKYQSFISFFLLQSE